MRRPACRGKGELAVTDPNDRPIIIKLTVRVRAHQADPVGSAVANRTNHIPPKKYDLGSV
jgi:hypothetical protein